MAEETVQKELGPKKRLSKGKAIAVMVTGGVLLVLPWFLPAAEGSSMQIGKSLVSVAGFITLCLGSYFRP